MFNQPRPIIICKFIGKHRALSHKVAFNFRCYLEIGLTSVEPILKHWIFM